MRDQTFGELNYEFGWNGTVLLDCFGKKETVDFTVYGEEESDITDYQRKCFTAFLEAWNGIQNEVLTQICSYYENLIRELGYGDGPNPQYPLLKDPEKMKELIHLDLILINEEGIYEGRCVGLAFSCTWDDENGLGVLLLNEQVKEIGYQDIVF